MHLAQIIQFTILGLATAGIYAVAASGLVVTYQTSGIFNFAHGAMGMIIAYVYWDLRVRRHVPGPLALVIALFVVAPLLGALVERLLMRHLAGSSVITRIVITIGLLVGLLGVAQVLWSGNITPVPKLPRFFGDNVLRFSGVSLPWHQVVVLVCAVLVAIGLRIILKKSRLGVAMRAVVDDRDLAGLNGCNPARTSMASWMLGSFLAGLAGILIAPSLGNLDQATLTLLVINAFAAAMVGRLRSLPLTFLGAVILGLASSYMDLIGSHMTTIPTWYSDVRGSLPTILLFGVLIFIPQDRVRVSAAVERLGRIPRPSVAKALTASAVVLVVVVIVSSLLTGANLRALGLAVALAIVMLSYVPLTGYAGQISLAQLTFAGLGAYIAVRVVGPNGSLLGLVVAFVAAAIIGALVALPALRLRGLYLALATMAFALVVENVVFAGDAPFSSDSRPFGRPTFLAGQHAYLLFMTAIFVAFGLGVFALRRSAFGRRLQAMKDSPAASATIGMNLVATKLAVFALSAGIAGVGGYLLGCWKGQAGQSDFSLINGALPGLAVLLLTVVGGIAVISGAFVGAMFLVAMPRLGEMVPSLNNIMMILPGFVGVTLARNPDGAVMQVVDRFRERFGGSATEAVGDAPSDDGATVEVLGPEAFVIAGAAPSRAQLDALGDGLGVTGEQCGAVA
ncbi:MAG: ABC transporter permease [Actinobacteria bacterium]|nr:ABC transporter permease [Actinomycetota bacterium]